VQLPPFAHGFLALCSPFSNTTERCMAMTATVELQVWLMAAGPRLGAGKRACTR
jgi:hypothetical protein